MNLLKSLSCIFLFVLCSITWGEVINVPGDIATIQAGINQATDGDTVLVAEGIYYENINFNGKPIMLGSLFLMDEDTSHISKTIINGSKPSNPDSGTVVYIISGEDTNSVLCGFTITGGSGTNFVWEDIQVRIAGGVLIDSSGAKIVYNKICNNIIDANDRYCYSGGIEAFSLPGMDIIIEANEICYNEVYGDWGGGGGATLSPHGYLLFKNNNVHHNLFESQRAGHGGGIASMGSKTGLKGKIIMIGNRIMNNEVHGSGTGSFGGGYYTEFPDVEMYNNIIAENTAYYGGGLCVLTLWGWADTARVQLVNNTIAHNDADVAGAVWNRQSNVVVLNSILWNPSAKNEIDGLNAVKFEVNFSDVRGGWPYDSDNCDSDPKFIHAENSTGDSLYYCLDEASPCIDAGDSTSKYSDKEDPLIFGYALWPAMGTIRNDMGAYGGTNQLVTAIEYTTEIKQVPEGYILSQNYPNPFNPSTTIEFTLPQPEYTTLKIYNILGAEVATLVSDKLQAGRHTYQFDGSKFASGIYYYQVSAGEFRDVRKMILLR